ncbi:MAG: type II toxin-antitoxin system PemK/MazF family toxin, partial [bacterium]
GLAIVCPITNTDKRIPFHLPVPASSTITSFVMVDQVKSIDYVARKAKLIEKAPDQLLTDVLGVLDACVK